MSLPKFNLTMAEVEMFLAERKRPSVEQTPAPAPGMKWCNGCEQWKQGDEIEFNKRRASPDGLAYSCRDCERKYKQSRKEADDACYA